MKICLINGSPKNRGGTSAKLLAALEPGFGEGHTVVQYKSASGDPDELIKSASGCDALVVAFPLYADGIPSHLLRLLASVESMIAAACPGAAFYAVVNSGFYEARQNRLAIALTQVFCEKAGLAWGQGLAIGCGPMLANMPLNSPPVKNVANALNDFAANIAAKKSADTFFVRPAIPRFFYITAGNFGWRMSARQNGLSQKSLRAAVKR